MRKQGPPPISKIESLAPNNCKLSIWDIFRGPAYVSDEQNTDASTRDVLLKNVFLNFTKFTGKYPCWSLFFNKVAGIRDSDIPTQVFCCKFCEVFKNTFFPEQLQATLSGNVESTLWFDPRSICNHSLFLIEAIQPKGKFDISLFKRAFSGWEYCRSTTSVREASGIRPSSIPRGSMQFPGIREALKH